ncbi:alpha-amylase [Prevotella sp. 10(H)]|uniref:alpha-amylase n=1 Tax=Prevotella sp. 10(H) TaxID=1158294 RepID=UPI0004A6DD9F|nr:alpha-amylase [Prevotella sp. 10(H)]
MKNGVMIQYFEWNLPNKGEFWNQLKKDSKHLHEIGVTSVWIPPACKATTSDDVGYGIYDLYDLGEFDQKGSVRTKYGTKEELKAAIEELQKNQICVYFDAVMNHKAGADYTEKFLVKEVDPNDRERQISDAYEIEGWTGFDFPGRGDKYSNFKWHYYHFSGTDFNQENGKVSIYQIQGDGKAWAEGVDGENSNYDYLMFADIDFDHPEVIEDVSNWGKWVANELNLDGFRLDAIKHINSKFIGHFLDTVRKERGEEFYAVGEYWRKDVQSLNDYLAALDYKVDLFDVALHYNFYQASKKGKDYDLQHLMDDTLVKNHPEVTVTFVDNHDSQWGSSLESQVDGWFKPLAYGLILLQKEGYPCVFYGDYYSIGDKQSPHHLIIDILLDARRKFAYGDQQDYFDHPNTVGFYRTGDDKHPGSGLVFLMSNGEEGFKTINVGENRKGEVWYEFTGNIKDEVTIDENGNGTFTVEGGNLAVWVKKG